MNNTPDTQDICALLPLVRHIARRIHLRPNHPCLVEHEDLVHEGVVGLLEAARRFDPGADTALSTFAYHRIRGAMLDAVSKAQRQLHLKSRYARAWRGVASPTHKNDRLVHFYGASLREALADLGELQRFFIAGQIQEESDRDRCAEVGLTYWQYRKRREKTLAHLRTRLGGRHSAKNSAPNAPVVT